MSDSDRQSLIRAFTDKAGWGDSALEPLAGDASTRRYVRLRRGARTAMLMDAPPGAEAAPCPPDASPEARAKLGYNALARLAGPNAAAFAGLAGWLRAQGLSAPEIIAADLPQGLILMEDFGDALFAREMARAPDTEAALYGAAIEALARLHDAAPPAEVAHDGGAWPILTYDAPAALAEADLLLDWYAQHKGAEIDAAARESWTQAWMAALSEAEGGKALTLRDYHAENLIWLAQRHGAQRAGLLDYQDALAGHPAYDLVSLAEDARRDVSPATQAALLDQYLSEAAPADRQAFRAAYAIWGAQRNAKILGIFVRLALRDGKARYLDLLPRVEAYFREDLSHEALAPVRAWTSAHLPELIR